MTRIVRIRLTLEVPDDMEVQVNRDEGPETFEGFTETGGTVSAPVQDSVVATVLAGPAPLCPRHKKSLERGGAYFCPTVISPPGVEPKQWCDWRVTVR